MGNKDFVVSASLVFTVVKLSYLPGKDKSAKHNGE